MLYVTEGDDATFLLVQRTTGRKTELPADPKLSPDRPRLVTADFCERRCTNEVALWRVTRDGVRKELVLAAGRAVDRRGRDVEGRRDPHDRIHGRRRRREVARRAPPRGCRLGAPARAVTRR